jgi:hypothetical protein
LKQEQDSQPSALALSGSNPWNENYESVKEYVQNIGTKENGPLSQRLKYWMYRQRKRKRNTDQGLPSILTDEQEESLGLLSGDIFDLTWNKRYEELVEYKKEHGHSMVPRDSQTHKALGKWVHNQRQLYRKNMQGKLRKGSGFSDERISLLNELDFVWDPLEDLWTKRYAELVEFYEEHGHSMVPQTSQTHKTLAI